MLADLIIAALVAGAVVLSLWLLRGCMLRPLRPGKSSALSVRIRVTGPEPALEQTIDALLWLRENKSLPADIVIEDAGMDEETRRVAQLLAKTHSAVTIIEYANEKETDPCQTPSSTSK